MKGSVARSERFAGFGKLAVVRWVGPHRRRPLKTPVRRTGCEHPSGDGLHLVLPKPKNGFFADVQLLTQAQGGQQGCKRALRASE